jgi:hypothetical protein
MTIDLTTARDKMLELMTDVCVISTPEALGPLDESTGLHVVASGSQIYNGPCIIRPIDNNAGIVDMTISKVFKNYSIKIPFDAPEISIGQVASISSSEFDALLVGRIFVIKGISFKTLNIVRRLVGELQQ